jgi:hypothetical protein
MTARRDDMADQIAAQAFVIRAQQATIDELQDRLAAKMAHLDHAPMPERYRAAEGWLDDDALHEIAEAECPAPRGTPATGVRWTVFAILGGIGFWAALAYVWWPA